MRRFFTKILLISLFFTGIGAIAESVWNEVFIAKTESKVKQIKIIKIDSNLIILPNFENFEKNKER